MTDTTTAMIWKVGPLIIIHAAVIILTVMRIGRNARLLIVAMRTLEYQLQFIMASLLWELPMTRQRIFAGLVQSTFSDWTLQ